MPMIAIMARRVLAISVNNSGRFAVASLDVSTFQPKSPVAVSAPADWSNSQSTP